MEQEIINSKWRHKLLGLVYIISYLSCAWLIIEFFYSYNHYLPYYGYVSHFDNPSILSTIAILIVFIIFESIRKLFLYLITGKPLAFNFKFNITKIALWMMILISVWGIVFSVGDYYSLSSRSSCFSDFGCGFGQAIDIFVFVFFLLFFILSNFVLKRRKWAWDMLMDILYLISALFILLMFDDLGLIVLIPIIIAFLLFVDRKNYWKIAS